MQKRLFIIAGCNGAGKTTASFRMKLGQKIVTQIDGKIVTRSPDYFLKKQKK